ncbi:SPOR domain-containing protein [Allohahella sp. A8]|uniref:SPOR domain-containing protein n=1 Tax=Allohahella sp. A8 TaxID=3141461 RepID=UPI003A802281
MFQLPERKEFLDNLRHLAHFSEKAILVTADSRGSISHLVSALSAVEGDGLFVVDVDLSTHESLTQVLQSCLKRLQLDSSAEPGETDAQMLGRMQQYAARMAAAGQRVLLIFRAADEFGADSTLALTAALQAGQGLDNHWGIMLAADTAILKSLSNESRAQSLLLQLHLRPLSRDEFGEYAALQLGALVPSRQKLDRYHKKLGGLPEKVDAFILEQRAQPVAVSASAKDTANKAAVMSGAAASGKGFVPDSAVAAPAKRAATASGISAAAAMAGSGSTAPEPASAAQTDPAIPPPQRQSLLKNRMLVLPVVIAALGTAVMAALFLYEPQEQTPEVQETQSPFELESTPIAPSPTLPDTASEAVVLDDGPTVPAEVEGSAVAGEPTAPAGGRASSSDLVDRIQEQFVRQRAAGGFSPDELVAEEDDSKPDPAKTSRAESLPTDTQAGEAPALDRDLGPESSDRSQLASRLLEKGAVAQKEAVKKVVEALPQTKPAPQPQPETGEVKRVDVESAPTVAESETTSASGSDRFRSAEWLAAQPSENWTIQMLGSYSEPLVVRFLSTRPGLEKAVYIRSTYKNKPWFIVLNGSYATKAEAQRIVQALPGSLKKEDFWIRQIGGLK